MAKILTQQHENTSAANVESGLETRELGYTDEALKLELIFKTNAGIYRHFPSSERMGDASSNANSGAKKIGFYPTAAGMVSTNIQDAIEELETLVGTGLTGTGIASAVAYWSAPSVLTGSANFSYDGVSITISSPTSVVAVAAFFTSNNAYAPGTFTTYGTLRLANTSATADASTGIYAVVGNQNVGGIVFFHKSTSAHLGGTHLLYGSGSGTNSTGLTLDETGKIYLPAATSSIYFSHASAHSVETSDGNLTIKAAGPGTIGNGRDLTFDYTPYTDGNAIYFKRAGTTMALVDAAGLTIPSGSILSATDATRLHVPYNASVDSTTNTLRMSSTTKSLYYGDGTRERQFVAGWSPTCNPIGYHSSMVTDISTSLPANGGSRAVPMNVQADILLEEIFIATSDTTLARSLEWRIYIQDQNSGQAGENTLREVVGANGTLSYTAAAATVRLSAASGAPVYLSQGVYWIVIRNTHATNTLGLSLTTGGTMGDFQAQTKTLGSALGASLDFVAATWSKATAMTLITLANRVFGQTSSWP